MRATETPKPPIARLSMPVRWSDQDRYCHVNNVAYFQYFEEARGQWLSSIGYPMNGQGEGPVVIKTGATYLKEINYPSNLVVETYLYPPGNTSLGLFHRIIDAEDEKLYAEGNVKLVWVDHAASRPIPLPKALRELADQAGWDFGVF